MLQNAKRILKQRCAKSSFSVKQLSGAELKHGNRSVITPPVYSSLFNLVYNCVQHYNCFNFKWLARVFMEHVTGNNSLSASGMLLHRGISNVCQWKFSVFLKPPNRKTCFCVTNTRLFMSANPKTYLYFWTLPIKKTDSILMININDS